MKYRKLLFIGCLAFLWDNASASERLSSMMGEVLLRNLQPGATYHLTPLMNFPLRVTYDGDKPVVLLITPSYPEPNEIKEGFEPIPTLDWISLEPTEFELPGSSTAESNITISIPNDEALLGRKFVVYLWSRTIAKAKGLGLGLGTKSRLLITIAKERQTLQADPASRSYMNFKLSPSAVSLTKVRPGEKVNLHRALKKKFYIENQGDEQKEFSLRVVQGKSMEMDPPQDAEWGPEDTEFEIKPEKTVIGPRAKKRFKIMMKIPDRPECYGKNFHYLIRVTPHGVGVSSGILFRMNVGTVEK